MSTFTEKFLKELGSAGDPNVLDSIETIMMLSKERQKLILSYIEDSTKDDLAEIRAVRELLRSTEHDEDLPPNAGDVYGYNPKAMDFVRFLKGKPSIEVYSDDNVSISIADPMHDIALGYISNFNRLTVTPVWQVHMRVTMTVHGLGSTMQVTSAINHLYNETSTPDSWLDAVAFECKTDIMHLNTSKSLEIEDMHDAINSIYAKPYVPVSEETKSHIKLLRYLLENVRGEDTLASATMQEVVQQVIAHFMQEYNVWDLVDDIVVENLMELSDLLGFVRMEDSLVIEKSLGTLKSSPAVVIVKKEGNWVRADKAHPAYKRALLAKQLQ